MSRRSHALVAVAAVLLAALAGACVPPPNPPAGWDQVFITRDGADVTNIRPLPDGRMQVTSPASNRGSNSRSFFWQRNSPSTRDQQSCATVVHSGVPVQEGVALRLAPSPGGGTRGISVQKNIAFNANWIYNVHLFDTANPELRAGRDFNLQAGHDFGPVVSEARRAGQPLRLCARVEGRALSLKLWPAHRPAPAWGDPTYTRTMTLPASWVYNGRPGYYIGHVPPGGTANFAGMNRTAL